MKYRRSIIALVALSLLQSSESNAANLCMSAFMRLGYFVQSKAERLFNPNIHYTGYYSNRYRSVAWTPELVEKVMHNEGVYAPIVRSYAAAMKLSLPDAAQKLAYLKDAPEDIANTLAILHKWESLAERSPFISTASNKSSAASFGPYGFSFDYQVGPSVLFKFDTKNLQNQPIKVKRALESWDIVERIANGATRDQLEKLEGPVRSRSLAVFDWLKQHDWMRAVTLHYSVYETHPQLLKEDLQKPGQELLRNLFNTNKPTYGDIALMGLWEGENLVYLNIPPANIKAAKFYDNQGHLVKSFAR